MADTDSPAGPAEQPVRTRLIEALMALLAERPYERIDLVDVAGRAGVGLDAFRAEFGSKLAVLAAFAKEIDRKVLADVAPEDGEESPRERLFDVLMRRFELLAPYRGALASLQRSLRRDPALALAVNPIAVRSMSWMLAAAGIRTAGPRGAVRAQALALLFARVVEVFLDDDDPGLARTMARLDRELSRAASWSRRLDDLCRLMPGRSRSWRGRRSDDRPGDEAAPAAAI